MAGLVDILHKGYQLRAFDNLPAPVMKPCVVDGTTGSTSLSYTATYRTINGETLPATEIGVANAYATLDAFHRVKVWVEVPPAGARYVRFYKADGELFKLLSEVAVPADNTDAVAVWDQGQALTNVQPPTEDTSGRDYLLLLPNDKKDFQRAEMSDLQAFFVKMIEGLADQIHAAGDVITGCGLSSLGDNRWAADTGRIYAGGGFYVPIPADEVEITGVGKETVGVKITPRVVTHTDDPVLRNPDENVAYPYMSPGCDRLAVTVQWVVDDPAQVPIQDFLDGQPVVKTIPVERTELKRMIARMINDLAGTFGVKHFQCSKLDHQTDATKFRVRVGTGGKAYPTGWETELAAPQIITIPKARDYTSINEATTDPFINYGGSVTSSNLETFNLNGKSLKLRVGSGGSHTVNFVSDGMSAQDVCTAVLVSVNAYPSAESAALVTATPVDGAVKIAARAGYDLAIEAVANDAYTVLGISTGTHAAVGNRLYAINDQYVRAVSDLSYAVETVVAITHDGTTNKDLLPSTTVFSIIGASLAEADAWDGKFDFHSGVDFGRSGNFIDFTLYGGSDPANGQTLYVKFRYNREAVKGTRTLVEVTDIPITKGSEDGADNLTYTGAASVKRIRDGVAVTGLTGSMIDAVEILRINDTPGQSLSEYNAYAIKKNSTALAHATSQVDWSAAGNQGVTPGGQPTTGAQYYCTVRAWLHEIEGDVVVADSYDVYDRIEAIPGLTDLLRDYLDFRTGGTLPLAGDNPGFDYEYYLSRKDRLVMDWTGVVQHIQGEAAYDPPLPKELEGSYSIAVLSMSPYTYTLNDVTIIPTGTLRLKQSDLVDLKLQVQKLAYDAATTQLSQRTVNESAAVEAKGLFADPIAGQGRCDVAFNKGGVRFDAAVDAYEQCIRLPIESSDPKFLEIDDDHSVGIRRVGNTVTMDYEEEVVDQQLKASSAISVNPDNVVNFNNAVLTLDPAIDVFMDEEQLPALNVNIDNGLQALSEALNLAALDANSITWGSWHLANGTEPVTDVTLGSLDGGLSSLDWASLGGGQRVGTEVREGTATTLVVGQQTVDLGNRVVDITAVPMMRAIEVTCNVKALAPSIDYAVSIEGVVCDFTAVSTSAQGVLSYEGHTTVAADASGTVTAKFVIPSGIPMGTAHVRVFAASNPDISSAMALFYSQGWMQQSQATTIGYESAVTRDVTVSQYQSILTYIDPLAQTFLIQTGPRYLSAVGLYFKKKSATLPVTVEIRGTTNGYPNRQVYLSKTLLPEDVLVSADASLETKFVFENVVGFQPEEYCMVVLSNDDAYEVWSAKIGEIDLASGETILSQPHDGVMFHSPNASTWTAHTDSDIKFKLYKSNFQNDLQIVFKEMTGLQAAQFIVMASEVMASCNVSWSYSLDGAAWIPIRAGIDVYLGEITDKIQLLIDVTNLGGSYQIIEKWAGILLQLCAENGNYISYNQTFVDDLNLPNSLNLYCDLAVDGVNGAGVRSVTPFMSIDDGLFWVELSTPAGYVPVAVGDGTYREFQFVTPTQQTIEGASNTTPIVITSTGHTFKDNAIVDISGVAGNTAANGTWRVSAATDDTFALVDPETGADSVGNGTYTENGTITMAEFDQCRIRLALSTTNKARTPKARRIRGNAA